MPNEEVTLAEIQMIPQNCEIPVRLLIRVKPGKVFRYIETIQWDSLNKSVARVQVDRSNPLDAMVVAVSPGTSLLSVKTRIAIESVEYSVEIVARVHVIHGPRETPDDEPAYTVTLEWGTPRLQVEAPGAAGQQTS